MAKQEPDVKISFKESLNLPKTDFPIRANASITDPRMLKRWQQEDLYRATFDLHQGAKKFILHDGPPYANGNIHIGHAYNKILKDIVTKSQRMMGKHVPVTPGWDCHGLPIEFKVSQDNPNATPIELKKACRIYAATWIDRQREQFKQLGVLMDWDRPYTTMDYSYEAAILRSFGSFVAQGYIERKNKTIPWCPTCKTALAMNAEIEYHDRKDPSIYVLFQLSQDAVDVVFPSLAGSVVSFVVWTTTPWTLPLNRALLLNPQAQYVVLDLDAGYIIVAETLADAVCNIVQKPKIVIGSLQAHQLIEGYARAHHPFIDGLMVPIIADDSVQLNEGTAIVHCAPGCGPDDYEIGVRNKLEIFSPISPEGTYWHGIQPVELENMPVHEGKIWVIKKLASLGKLFAKKTITHSYPHCWRCHQGLIFRATRQWFCDLSKGNLRNRVVEALGTITTFPAISINRLKAAIEGRLEWCLSRQRVWGVPIPALLCTRCDYTYISQSLIEKVADRVQEEGIEYWDSAVVDQFLPEHFACPLCMNREFRRETDILDVWFDSGISHTAVLLTNPALAYPADVYLEGKDQHRGWFQSSLLTAVALHGSAPMKAIVTHGYTVDEHGRKMSKSLGNVVAPQEMVARLGVDGVRLWAASLDLSGDAIISDQLQRNVEHVFNKIRNTCRFLLSNLYDFDHERDALPLDSLSPIDRYALENLFEVNNSIIHLYQEYDFTAVVHRLTDYCTTELSAFYLDIIKDRLYADQSTGRLRRSAQTVCWAMVDTLTRLIAPLLSVTAEHISDLYQKKKQCSIHLQLFAHHQKRAHESRATVDALSQQQCWKVLKSVRSALLKGIEGLRASGTISHSLEARLTLYFAPELMHVLRPLQQAVIASDQTWPEFWQEFIIVSQVAIVQSEDSLYPTIHKDIWMIVEHAHGEKCPRCWKWHTDKHDHALCSRCFKLVK